MISRAAFHLPTTDHPSYESFLGRNGMANQRPLDILKQGVGTWNQWRQNNRRTQPLLSDVCLPRADLSGVDLAGADLSAAHLEGANLSNARLNGANLQGASLCGWCSGPMAAHAVSLSKEVLVELDLGAIQVQWTDLTKAELTRADLRYADVSGANLRGATCVKAKLRKCNLTWANLEKADLRHAVLEEAHLYEAHLSSVRADHAKFVKCHLEGCKLDNASLIGADLHGAYLIQASLVDADITDALITGCYVHGISSWNIKGAPREQLNLVISRSYAQYNEPVLTVDNLEVAQFVYLILVNQKIRDVIDTITARAVLILGRFEQENKAILDVVREALRRRGYVPILFDFTPSPNRDLTETVQLLANMSKFVIADLSDPKSIPQELSALIPFLPNVRVQPIIREGQREYAMFEHWRRYPWVLPEFVYRDKYHLIEHLDADVIGAAERRQKRTDFKP